MIILKDAIALGQLKKEIDQFLKRSNIRRSYKEYDHLERCSNIMKVRRGSRSC